VLADRNLERGQAAAASVGPRARAVVADVSDPDQVRAMAATIQADYGRWDVLVNNAAALRFGSVESGTLEDWNAVLQGTLTTAMLCSQAAVAPMKAAGAGRIINIVSVVAQGAPSDRLAGYTAAKAGLIGLTLAAARELGPLGITVNAVSPGAIVTDAWNKFPDPEALREQRAAVAAVGRVGTPAEIGGAVRYLASLDAGFVTGQTLVVDGGRIDKL
jgi:NAD(P)-dependent dehydrogenase (short-subunit alcohol dehydrogenase family)